MRRRNRILQAIAVLPSMATILNGLSGFAAIHFATKEGFGSSSGAALTQLMIAAGMIFLAMLFDVVDGSLARITRRTSEFGADLDSLCDVISFGVAPAVLFLRTIFMIIRDEQIMGFAEPAIWCIGALFVACAALRLARFNVETSPELAAHMSFKGLPSPAAAAVVASLVLSYGRLENQGVFSSRWQHAVVAGLLAAMTLLSALLMVSRIRYPHVINRFFRGKKPFGYLVKLVLLLVAAVVGQLYTLAIASVAFALSGPVVALFRVGRPSIPAPPPLPPAT